MDNEPKPKKSLEEVVASEIASLEKDVLATEGNEARIVQLKKQAEDLMDLVLRRASEEIDNLPQPPEIDQENLQKAIDATKQKAIELIEQVKAAEARIRQSITGPVNQTTAPESPQTPEGAANARVQAFLDEFNITAPEGFEKLTNAQQVKVIEDLKQVVVLNVRAEAKATHAKALAEAKAKTNSINRAFISVFNTFTQNFDIKNQEVKTLNELKSDPDKKQKVASNLEQLIKANQEKDIFLNEAGKPCIDYSKELDLEENDYTRRLIQRYNKVANDFRAIPYSWGEEKISSINRKKYDDAKAAYEAVHADIRRIKTDSSKGAESQIEGERQMVQLKHQVILDQMFSENPDVEIEFAKIHDSAGSKEWEETALRIFGVQNREKVLLAAGGYAMRAATKATLGFIAAPVVGGLIGGIRGRMQAKEKIAQNRKEARYGHKETGLPMDKYIDATNMKSHLDNILIELNKPNLSDKRREHLLKKIQIRVGVTEEKLKNGLINFGDRSEMLQNRYDLNEKMEEALVMITAHDPQVHAEVKRRVQDIMGFHANHISEAREEFLNKAMMYGALRGAGMAVGGYLLRLLTEEGVSEKMERVAKDLYANAKKIYEHLGKTQLSSINSGFVDDGVAQKVKINVAPEKINIDNGEVKQKTIDAEKIGTEDKLAIVAKGKGITHAFKAQIQANPEMGDQLAKEMGYKGKVGSPAFYKALGQKFGYIDNEGNEIRVKASTPGTDSAYKLVQKDGKFTVEEYRIKDGDWKLVEKHSLGQKFEGKDFEKDYEYTEQKKSLDSGEDKAKIKINERTDSGILAPEKVVTPEATEEYPAPQKVTPNESVERVEHEYKTDDYDRESKTEKDRSGDADVYGEQVDRKVGVVRGPDGRPWIVEDFNLVGNKAIRLFADRYKYNILDGSQIDFVGQTYKFHLKNIFGSDSDAWTDKWNKESATKLLRMRIRGEVNTDKEELSSYIKMLQQETGIKPFKDPGPIGASEQAKDYILRMLLELEKRNKLEDFTEKFKKFLADNQEKDLGEGRSDEELDRPHFQDKKTQKEPDQNLDNPHFGKNKTRASEDVNEMENPHFKN